MKSRSVFEWFLIALLSILLAGMMVGFGYLVFQYQSSTGLKTKNVSMSEYATPEVISITGGSKTTPTMNSLLAPTLMAPVSQNTPITNMTATSQYTLKSLLTPGYSPNQHFLTNRPMDSLTPFWPPAEFRYGSLSTGDTSSGIHTGLDILADYGTPIYALDAGEVIWSGYGIESYAGPNNPYGVAVTIKHDTLINNLTVYSIYAHISVTHVEAGDRVIGGDLIGEVGLTGKTSGPHLHIEVRLGDDQEFVTRNPELFIPPFAGHGVLAARLLNTDGSILYNQPVSIESLANHQIWLANSYGSGASVPDYILKENLVIGDLPAGQYLITITYAGANLQHSIFIYPDEITFFVFEGYAGFSDGLPEETLKPLRVTP